MAFCSYKVNWIVKIRTSEGMDVEYKISYEEMVPSLIFKKLGGNIDI